MNRIVFRVFIVVLVCVNLTEVVAQDTLRSYNLWGKHTKDYVHSVAVQIGTDIGGAVPVPFNYIPKTFVPTPSVLPNIGLRYSFNLPHQWDFGGEINYKHVEMGADAIVANMKATLPNVGPDGGDWVQYFTGRAKMLMSFDMMEMPLYATYSFNEKGTHKILFGGYAAWIINSSFKNNPIEGFVGTTPDKVDVIVTPDSQIPPEQKDFSKYMTNWDAGLLIGYESSILRWINVGLKISFGFKDIFDVDILEYDMLHMRGTVTLSYDLWHL